MLSPTTLFSIFEEKPIEEIIPVSDGNSVPVPLLIKIFKKLIINHIKFSDSLVSSLIKNSYELGFEDVSRAGFYIVYNKAYNCISKIDIEIEENINHLKLLNNENDLEYCLDKSIEFFSWYEEYEKCSTLQNILISFQLLPF